ncbi:MAG: DNA-processing protein DprA [Phycisphaerales bacterium]|nr:MAG: DNA-processing protein DprA [Phycisphaerales bacterium]
MGTDGDSVISEVGRKYLQLQLTDSVGPIRLRNLTAHFGSLDAVLGVSVSELCRVEGIGEHTARSIFRSRSDDAVNREVERSAACGLRIVCAEDADYPKSLYHIPDSPICLYVRGHLEPTDSVAIAIVGSRRCSHYGREQAVRFGELLGGAGFTVVSGLARGIDGHAHRGALRGGGRTIAVLGNGLASVYPPEHKSLATDIADTGALLSEFPVDSPPEGKNFPRRNRIIIGLALGVIVVEASKRSGALISARLASEYNREVFAIPGRVDQPEYSAGANYLIRDGQAKLITCLEDVLDELGQVGEIIGQDLSPFTLGDDGAAALVSQPIPRLTGDEQKVLSAIAKGSEDADAICASTKLETSRIASTLTSLQLKGAIKRLPGDHFVKRGS